MFLAGYWVDGRMAGAAWRLLREAGEHTSLSYPRDTGAVDDAGVRHRPAARRARLRHCRFVHRDSARGAQARGGRQGQRLAERY